MAEKIETTKGEQAWIDRMEKVLAKMPDTLWLFTNGNALMVLKKADGERVYDPGGAPDQDYIVTDILCDIDGGDF